jgi:lambda family phage portal protein
MRIFGFDISKASVSEAPPVPEQRPRIKMRQFDGASIGRLSDYPRATANINDDSRFALRTLKLRSRELSKNNNLFRKYLSMRERNIVGPKGVMIQNRARLPDGMMDDRINDAVESAWAAWGGFGCEMSNRLAWNDVLRLAVRTMAVDGEFFAFLERGPHAGRHGFALRIVDSIACDPEYNVDSFTPGTRIIQGVEVDDFYRPIAYHFTARRYESTMRGAANLTRLRVPAEDVIHLFRQEFVEQTRGIPPAQSAMGPMNMLKGYSEAELAAARAGACKMGFYTSKDGSLQSVANGIDEEGNFIFDAEPGKFEVLPSGYDFKEYSPQHPNGNYSGFTLAMTREIAGGLDVSYNSLASDLTSVNYSSMRSGSLEERDAWMTEQSILISQFVEPVFRAWFRSWSSSAESPASAVVLASAYAPAFYPRRWPWVDPRADADANVTLMANNMKSPFDVAAEMGNDLDDLYSSIKKAKDLADKYEITAPGKDSAKPKTPATPDEEEDSEDEKDVEEEGSVPLP